MQCWIHSVWVKMMMWRFRCCDEGCGSQVHARIADGATDDQQRRHCLILSDVHPHRTLRRMLHQQLVQLSTSRTRNRFRPSHQNAVCGRHQNEIRRQRDCPYWETQLLQVPVQNQRIGTPWTLHAANLGLTRPYQKLSLLLHSMKWWLFNWILRGAGLYRKPGVWCSQLPVQVYEWRRSSEVRSSKSNALLGRKPLHVQVFFPFFFLQLNRYPGLCHDLERRKSSTSWVYFGAISIKEYIRGNFLVVFNPKWIVCNRCRSSDFCSTGFYYNEDTCQ